MQALPLIAELEAALTSGAARRVEMLARITELFISEAARYSEEQVGVFDDVMVRLASTVGADARAKLAQRLAPIANAPSSLTHMLAFDDEVEIATPILSQSERLEIPPFAPTPAASASSTSWRSPSADRCAKQ